MASSLEQAGNATKCLNGSRYCEKNIYFCWIKIPPKVHFRTMLKVPFIRPSKKGFGLIYVILAGKAYSKSHIVINIYNNNCVFILVGIEINKKTTDL